MKHKINIMVNAQEWLNNYVNQKGQVEHLSIYQGKHCENRNYNCNYCYNRNNFPLNYSAYNTDLEGELDLNDFTNLKQLIISGNNQDQRQRLTELKIDKCIKLTNLTINFTALTNLNLDKNINLQSLNCSNNRLISLDLTNNPNLQSTLYCNGNRIVNLDVNGKQLTNIIKDAKTNFQEIQTKRELKQTHSEIKRLVEIFKSSNISINDDTKLEIKKIEKENLTYQLNGEKSELEKAKAVAENHLDESCREWLETLLETQQEILQKSNSFARKQLERAKKILVKNLSAEEVEIFLGKVIEINELEKELVNLEVQARVSNQKILVESPPRNKN